MKKRLLLSKYYNIDITNETLLDIEELVKLHNEILKEELESNESDGD